MNSPARRSYTIRFAGDSGDGMQLVGSRFTTALAEFGNDVCTLPDYPAEIRAPAGTVAGVSGFQIQFADHDIHTPGDRPDCLVAMNPAALKGGLADLGGQGLVIVNADAFTAQNLEKAGYTSHPLEDGSLKGYSVLPVAVTTMTLSALEGLDLPRAQAERCKNFFVLGLALWLFEKDLEITKEWIGAKFAKNATILEANRRALEAGHAYGETIEKSGLRFAVSKVTAVKPGQYCHASGNEAAAYGLVAAAEAAGRPLFLGSYPITPASEILQELAKLKGYNVTMFQAEDEIAAACATVGAAYGGSVAATSTSGPGLCLKLEAINLAVMAELPIVIIDVQRSGPSTGLPTKTEQADLLQAFFGRNGESPVAVLAAQTPSDCFALAYEAVRLAVRSMAPAILLTDGYLGNGAEPLRIPEPGELPPIAPVVVPKAEGFQPYARDEKTLARPWVAPGTPGFEHRIGGLEKQDLTGAVSYDPVNHDRMCRYREEKIARLVDVVPDQEVFGAQEGELLVLGWGSTFGAIRGAVEQLIAEGKSVGHAQVRYLNPFPRNLGEVLGRFRKVLVPEINLGQLSWLLRARYLRELIPFNQIKGQPMKISEIAEKAREILEGRS